jgi:hypothetical protein
MHHIRSDCSGFTHMVLGVIRHCIRSSVESSSLKEIAIFNDYLMRRGISEEDISRS